MQATGASTWARLVAIKRRGTISPPRNPAACIIRDRKSFRSQPKESIGLFWKAVRIEGAFADEGRKPRPRYSAMQAVAFAR